MFAFTFISAVAGGLSVDAAKLEAEAKESVDATARAILVDFSYLNSL